MSQVSRKIGTAPLRNGFSLVEVLVVVMVILVIAAIAIPSFVHARMRANEASALVSMKTIHTAEVLYAMQYPELGYAPNLAYLGPNGTTCENVSSTASCIIMDEGLTSGTKNGYVFVITGDGQMPSANYTLRADPVSDGISGRCGFSAGQGGDITINPSSGGPASRLSAGGNGC